MGAGVAIKSISKTQGAGAQSAASVVKETPSTLPSMPAVLQCRLSSVSLPMPTDLGDLPRQSSTQVGERPEVSALR